MAAAGDRKACFREARLLFLSGCGRKYFPELPLIYLAQHGRTYSPPIGSGNMLILDSPGKGELKTSKGDHIQLSRTDALRTNHLPRGPGHGCQLLMGQIADKRGAGRWRISRQQDIGKPTLKTGASRAGISIPKFRWP
jgi:hypothetical protein